jgi:hypothetical protein
MDPETETEYEVQYEYGDAWEHDFGGFTDKQRAVDYRDVRVSEKAYRGAKMRVVEVVTTVTRKVVA